MKVLRRDFFQGGTKVPVRQCEELADFIAACVQDGLDMDSVVFAIDRAFPKLKFRIFAGALMLYRCRSEAEGYALVMPPGKLQ